MSTLATPNDHAERRAHQRATDEFPHVVDRLRDLVGATLVAYLGGVRETRAVTQWAEQRRTPPEKTQQRLRRALHAAEILSDRDDAGVVRAWFQGMNPELGDIAPARLLRDGPSDEAGPAVLAAARSFRAAG